MRVLGLILAAGVALGACGFGPNDDLTGRRIGDGVSPWEDLGAVQLCLGNDRIGPAGSAVGGFCVDINKPNEAICLKDSDCQSRELCSCGRCTMKYCSQSAECPAGRTCSFNDHRCLPICHESSDCTGKNEICSGGMCKALCGGDGDCQYGEVCGSQSRCVVAGCATTANCRATELCKVQRLPRETAQPDVHVLGDPPVYTMFVEMADTSGTKRSIYRATAHDGIHFAFDPALPVIDGNGDAHAPSFAVLPGGGYRLYYETAAGIVAVEGSDGKTWGSPTLVIAGDYHAPAAVVTAQGPVVYVQVGARNGLALWTGAGTPQPVLRPADASDPVLWREINQLGSPAVLLESSPLGEPTLKLWFDAFGKESATSTQFGNVVELPPNDSIGFASTLLADAPRLAVYPFNPVFDRIVAFLGHRGESQPSVLRLPGAAERYYLYYVGRSGDGKENDGIGVARNPPSRGDTSTW